MHYSRYTRKGAYLSEYLDFLKTYSQKLLELKNIF